MSEQELWSREGFVGDAVRIQRPYRTVDFLRVDGPHIPRRLQVRDVSVPAEDGSEPVTVLAEAATGLRIAVANRTRSMPYVVRNVECDELHFIQDGTLRFRTGLGALTATAGEFVCIPRSVHYAIAVVDGPALSVIVESPQALRALRSRLDLFDPERDLVHAELEPPVNAGGEVLLLLKAGAETTRYLLPYDPFSAVEQAGVRPVWKVPLEKIRVRTEGPPVAFVGTEGNDVLVYTLSSAPSGFRPPMHLNADYDEVIHYFRGPGAYGAIDEPGTLTCVPKGVAHKGPTEDVPAGYLAWLLETRPTLRWTSAASERSDLMETDMYGRHPNGPTVRGPQAATRD